MDKKTPVELDRKTATALTEMFVVIGSLEQEIVRALGLDCMRAIGTQVMATLRGRQDVSSTNEDFLREVATLLAGQAKIVTSERRSVALLNSEDEPIDEPASEPTADLAEIFAAIGEDGKTLAAARMIAANLILNALSADVFLLVGIESRRKAAREQFVSASASGQISPPCPHIDLNSGAVETIVANLKAARHIVGVEEKKTDLAVAVHFAHVWTHACQHECNRQAREISWDIKKAVERMLKRLQKAAPGDDSGYRSGLIAELLSLVGEVGTYLEKVSVQERVDGVG